MENLKAEVLLEIDPEATVYWDLDFAFIGTVRRCGSSDLAAYDLDKVIAFIEDQTTEDPFDYLDAMYPGPVYIKTMTLEAFSMMYPDTKIWLGLDEAFIGAGHKAGLPPTAVFSYEKCITIKERAYESSDFQDEDDDPRTIAIDDLEFNTLGAYIGPDTPFHLENEVDSDTERTEGD